MLATDKNLIGTWKTQPIINDNEIYTLVIDKKLNINLSSESDSINYPLATGDFVIDDTDNGLQMIVIDSVEDDYSKISIIDYDGEKFTTVIEPDNNFRVFKKQ